MRRSLFIIFSLLFSSSALPCSIDDEGESASSQPPSPKENEAGRVPAATGSDSLESIMEEKIKIVVEAEFFGHSVPKRSPRDPFETPITMRFSSQEKRAWVQTNIGTLYCNALNNTKDFNFTEAMKWFRRAADQGDAEAQYSIGMLYDYALGVSQDFTKAMQWYLLAAKQNHAGAQYCIGMLYDNTEGSVPDFVKAMHWYRLAAAQNHPSAQNNIGLLYAKGEGVPQDNDIASEWFQKAADQGHEVAKENIHRLKGKTKKVRFIPWISSKITDF